MTKIHISLHNLAALMTVAGIKPSMGGKSDLQDITLTETINTQLHFGVLHCCS